MAPATSRLSAILLVLAVSCGPASAVRGEGPNQRGAAHPAAALPDEQHEEGWTRHTEVEYGFSLALPSNWSAYDAHALRADDSQPGAETDLTIVFEGQGVLGLTTRDMKFLGIDTSPDGRALFVESGLAPYVQVSKSALPRAIALDDLVAAGLPSLEQALDVLKPVARRRVEVSGTPAVELRYGESLTVRGKRVSVAVVHFVVLRGTSAYDVILNAPADRLERYAPIFEKIARSIRFN